MNEIIIINSSSVEIISETATHKTIDFSEKIPILWNMTSISTGTMRAEQDFYDDRNAIISSVPFPFSMGTLVADLSFADNGPSTTNPAARSIVCTEVITGEVLFLFKPFVKSAIDEAHTNLVANISKYFNRLNQ